MTILVHRSVAIVCEITPPPAAVPKYAAFAPPCGPGSPSYPTHPPDAAVKFEPTPERQGDSFLIQHLREVAIDHQNGIFAGTNDLVEKIGGRPPTTLEEFINKHRAAFTA